MEMEFGNYLVVKEKENFHAVYQVLYGEKKLLTHKNTWRQATIIAMLLSEAYDLGFEDAKDRYKEEYY